MLARYYKKDYQAALLDIDVINNERPENPLACKYSLLRAQCVGGLTSYTGDRTPYFDALKLLISDCPETEEAHFCSHASSIGSRSRFCRRNKPDRGNRGRVLHLFLTATKIIILRSLSLSKTQVEMK